MKKGKRMMTAALLAVTCALGALPAHAQETKQGDSTSKITEQQRSELKSFRSDFMQAKKVQRKIRDLTHRLRDDSREMRHQLHATEDKALHDRVQKDLDAFHRKLAAAHKLHKADEDLSKRIHAARLDGDLMKLRELAKQRLQNKQQELALLEEAHNVLQIERAKLKKDQQGGN
ncbi:MAG TPA: hypothetical protein VFV52_05595 [Bacilli bacterium]|nr:hypothetical protein [Bacilli bacterium]